MRYEAPRQASVQDMTQARDARAERQLAMLARHSCPLVSFTLNIPGPVKNGPLIREGFNHALSMAEHALEKNGIEALERLVTRAFTGDEYLCALKADPLMLKRLMCVLEEADAFGRLLDLDVLDQDGRKISREAAGFPPRACLLCGRPASLCAPARAHGMERLFERTQEILADTLMASSARRIGQLAQKSLIYEALATPKPGLVDRDNSGAHRDMDLSTLIDSAAALGGYFEEAARTGIRMAGDDPSAAMEALRPLGIEAESAMLLATGGVNTHKGALYALGILCAAAGRVWRQGLELTFDALFNTAARVAQKEASRLPSLVAAGGDTNGIKQYAATGTTGARGEAAAGFPSVRLVALPRLRQYLREGLSLNDALAFTLIHLIPQVRDTNLMKRAGPVLYGETQKQIKELLARGPLTISAIQALDRRFTAHNLSPGGCADLLAAACFVHWLEEEATV
ncbi:MAG: citrate lyase holo-[acyl-carrier protein] synthase [Eubacteriales bacterium]|nr:citrate lyase holo-[acyl-carrier protein] synthase [Eubacteriales bacterium]